MANIEMLLGKAGARLDDICKLVVYVTDIGYREPVYRQRSTALLTNCSAARNWLTSRYSSARCATAMSPGPHTTHGTPNRW